MSGGRRHVHVKAHDFLQSSLAAKVPCLLIYKLLRSTKTALACIITALQLKIIGCVLVVLTILGGMTVT